MWESGAMKRFPAIAVAVFFAAATAAHACSCMERPLPEEVAETPAIFTGKVTKLEVIDVKDGVSKIEATVVPDRIFKGSVPKKVVFTTSDGCCYCTPWFDIARNYLFFAILVDGQLQTNACTRTKLLSEAKEEIQYLEQAAFNTAH
jgi:hypothetical protein